MKTNITKKQLDNICKEFIENVCRYEHVSASKISFEIINGFITLSVTAEYYEYSEVIDNTDDIEVKGFQYNPIA